MRRNGSIPILIALLFSTTTLFAEDKLISFIAVEADTGMVLREENADIERPPASMIKLMMMLLVSEGVDAGRWKLDQWITASQHAQRMGGTQVYLEAGEVHTVDNLMRAVSVASANDASMAIAEGLWGSEEAYLEASNKKAQELGMTNSEFHSVHGLPPDRGGEFDKTTARDMAILGRACALDPRVLGWTNLRSFVFRPGESEHHTTNKLLRRREDMDGLKTGFINAAGYCVTATLKKNGVRVVAVVMGHDNSAKRFTLAEQLLDEGVVSMKRDTIVKGGYEDGLKVSVANCETESVQLRVADPITITTHVDDWDRVQLVWEHPKSLTAPVTKDTKVGTVRAVLGNQVLAERDITVDTELEEVSWFWKVEKTVRSFLDGSE